MERLTKIAIIGCGAMGNLHAQKCVENSNIELVGVFDSDLDKTSLAAAKFGTKAFESVEELLFETDAVVVASTTSSHFSLAKEALEQGVHTLIEKPMTETKEEAAVLCDLATEKGLVLQVGFLERFRLALFHQRDDFFRSKYFIAMRFSMKPGRALKDNVVRDLAIHDIDLALFILGEEPQVVSAKGVAYNNENYLDCIEARLQFSDERIVDIHASRFAPIRRREWLGFSRTGHFNMDLNSSSRSCDPLSQQLRNFLGSVKGLEAPMSSGLDGFKALSVAAKIEESIGEIGLNRTILSSHRSVLPA